MTSNLFRQAAKSLLLLKRVNMRSLNKIIPKKDLEAFFEDAETGKNLESMIYSLVDIVGTVKPKLDTSIVHIFHLHSKDDAFEMAILNEMLDSIKCVRLKVSGQPTKRLYAMQCGSFKGIVVDHLGFDGFHFSPRRIGTHAFWLKKTEEASTMIIDYRIRDMIIENRLLSDDFDRIFIDYGINWNDVEKAMRENGITKKEIVAMINRAGQLRANRIKIALNNKSDVRFFRVPSRNKVAA